MNKDSSSWGWDWSLAMCLWGSGLGTLFLYLSLGSLAISLWPRGGAWIDRAGYLIPVAAVGMASGLRRQRRLGRRAADGASVFVFGAFSLAGLVLVAHLLTMFRWRTAPLSLFQQAIVTLLGAGAIGMIPAVLFHRVRRWRGVH